MRLILVSLLSLLGLLVQLSAQSTITAFTHVNVIPMTSETVLKDYTVLVKDGKVYKMGPADALKYSKKVETIDATGKYLMPGLAEMHAHIPTPVDGNDTEVRNVLFLYLANGVTTIRGMLGDPYHLGLRKEVMAGTVLGPRIFTSSPSINGNSVKTPEEGRQKAAQFKKDGYDFLKIHPGVKRDVFDALATTAQSLKLPFAGHVPVEVGIRHALAFRYASVDHLDGYLEGLVAAETLKANPEGGFFGFNYVDSADEKQLDALIAETKKQGVWVVPTQSLFTRWFSPVDANVLANQPEMQYMPSKTLYQWRQSKQSLTGAGFSEAQWKKFIALRQKMLRNMHSAGVDLLLGSDAPQVFNVPGFSLHHEMASLLEAGLTPYTILHSGTANPARYFGQSGHFGTIQPGASADFILLEGNPLEDITNTWKQLGVMLRGKWMSKAFIDAELQKIADKHKS